MWKITLRRNSIWKNFWNYKDWPGQLPFAVYILRSWVIKICFHILYNTILHTSHCIMHYKEIMFIFEIIFQFLINYLKSLYFVLGFSWTTLQIWKTRCCKSPREFGNISRRFANFLWVFNEFANFLLKFSNFLFSATRRLPLVDLFFC